MTIEILNIIIIIGVSLVAFKLIRRKYLKTKKLKAKYHGYHLGEMTRRDVPGTPTQTKRKKNKTHKYKYTNSFLYKK